jgi:hypothetical protein
VAEFEAEAEVFSGDDGLESELLLSSSPPQARPATIIKEAAVANNPMRENFIGIKYL